MLFSRLFLKIGQTYQRVNEKEPHVPNFKLQGNKKTKRYKKIVIENARKLLSQGNIVHKYTFKRSFLYD